MGYRTLARDEGRWDEVYKVDLLRHLYPRAMLQQNLRASGFRLERGARRVRINAAGLCHGAARRH